MSRHIAVVLCCTLGMLACSPDTPEQPAVQSAAQDTATASSAVYARVNQQVITRSQVDERVALLRAHHTGGVDPLRLRELARRQLVDESLVAQTAEAESTQRAVAATDAEKPAQQNVAQLSVSLRAMVAASQPPVTAEEVATWLARQRSVRDTNAVAASGVLVSVPRDGGEAAWRQAEARAQKLKARLAAGEISLAVAASRYSDHESARRQGRLGGVSPSRYPQIYHALAGSPVGSLVGPVGSEDGVWVVRQDARPAETAIPPARAAVHLQRQREVQAMSARLLALRAQAELTVETDRQDVPGMHAAARAPVLRVQENTLPGKVSGQPVLPGALYRAPPSHQIGSDDERDGGAP
jgi:hypothetical protein